MKLMVIFLYYNYAFSKKFMLLNYFFFKKKGAIQKAEFCLADAVAIIVALVVFIVVVVLFFVVVLIAHNTSTKGEGVVSKQCLLRYILSDLDGFRVCFSGINGVYT